MGATSLRDKRLAEQRSAGKQEHSAAAHDPERADSSLRIARDGTWYHEGTPIRRMPLVKLFATVLNRDENGHYWLQTPVEKVRIVVDDAPFVAVEMTAESHGRSQVLSFRTNVDDIVTAGPDNPIHVVHDSVTEEPSPYVLVRDRLEALITRSVFYDMVSRAEEVDRDGKIVLGVWSQGAFFPLGTSEPSR